MTDPTAQMGFQVGKTAMMAGQEYVEHNVGVALLSIGAWLLLRTEPN